VMDAVVFVPAVSTVADGTDTSKVTERLRQTLPREALEQCRP